MSLTAIDPATRIKDLARGAGFDLAGIAPVAPSPHADAVHAWLAAGRHGQMDYLARTAATRVDLPSKFPWARSIICVGLAYYVAPVAPPADEPAGKIARYAWGRDYHRVLEKRLAALERAVRADFPEPLTIRTYVDTGPILEREIAQRAGLGWTGKNTLLLHPRHGSYFVLGEMLTSLELPADEPHTDHCGTCTRCLDACPTQAITPYSVDATRCISYQTLENRGELPAELAPAMAAAGYVIGCDICQEVCPFNHDPLPTRVVDFQPQGIAQSGRVSLPVIAHWTEHDWDVATRGKAHRRAKLAMWQRNAQCLESSL